MADLLHIASEEEPEYPEVLEQVRLGLKPTYVLVFTRDVESVLTHYVEGPPVNGYVPCPGARCPICHVGDAPVKLHLLPVLSIARRAVEVLRISDRRGAGSLFSGLLPHLLGDDTAEKLFSITRNGAVFSVKVQALGEDADRCPGVIKGFVEAQEKGLSLRSAFPAYSAVELAEVPSVRRVLDARGGWEPPSEDDEGDAGA